MPESQLQAALAACIDRFNEGPPIWGMEESESIKRIEAALESGEPIDVDMTAGLPVGALLSPGTIVKKK